jgi:hypothetical protein
VAQVNDLSRSLTAFDPISTLVVAGAPGAKLDDDCAHAGLDKIRDRLK